MDIAKGDLADFGLGYSVKIEEAKLKIAAELNLEKLIDKAADQVDGGAIEILIVQLAKQALKGL